jgi:hypothetical protein
MREMLFTSVAGDSIADAGAITQNQKTPLSC